MGKILKVVSAIATVASFIPGIGTAIGIGVKALQAIAVATSVGGTLLDKPKAPRNSPAPSERLRASIDPRAFRKSAVGTTALNTDIRDEEFTDNQSLLHRFIVAAAHRVQSIDEVWFDDELAWSTTGGIASKFLGYLGVECYTEGSAANAKNISSRMGSTRRYTGCAWVYLRYKLTGNDKKAESPFAQSVPTRITIRGKGAPFYDPRKDSTVPGGSGSHRADNQATWEWNDNACRNPALTLLWNLLGWRINGELSVGRGIPKERIDLESFAIAANICDESVAKAGGGTEPRYRCDGVWSEGDSPTTVTDMLKASMNADLDDVDGKLRVTIFRDDTFVSDADFTTDDVLGAFDWEPITPLDQSFNIVRGAYTDPSNQSLYQQVDYPQQQATSPDGIDRIDTFNLPMVQSVSQAQRLAALRLGRERFSGTFRAEFQATAWRVQKNSIVRLTFAPLGFVNKTFRVVEMDLREDGVVPLLLREEDSSIYVAPALQLGVVAVNSTPYDPFKAPITEAINDAVALAQSKGKVWTGPSMPSLAESAVGDTWIGPDGTFYERVNEGGITLAGYAVTLAGFRPQLGWTLSANQVLRDTLAQADAAYASANDAIDQLIGLADDDIISRNEKITKLVPEVARLEDKWTALSTIATSLGVSTTAAASARTAWYTLLGGLSPAWNDITQDTPVTRASFDYARDTYDSALYDLDRAVKDKAASIATWAGVSGSGKPEDNATRNAFQGNYNAGATYIYGDVVLWPKAAGGTGSSYIRKNTGPTTGVAPSNTTHWGIMVEVGADGLPGTPGANGITYYTWYAYADSADGQVNFTTGSPGTRVYQGVAFNKTTATESTTPSDYTWSPYVGPPNFGLAAANGAEVAGSKIIRRAAGGGDWIPQVYSTESFVGGAYVSFKLEQGSDGTYGGVMVGLNTDPTATDYTTLDYAIYAEISAGSPLFAVESGVFTNIGSFTATDTFAVHYDGASVRYYKNGTVVRTVAVSSGIRFFLDSAMANPGTRASIISWAAAGAVGPQGPQGTAGLPGATGANGVTYYTWYAYADSADGQINFTTGSPGSRVYQGVAFNKTTATESTTPSDYTWSRYVGPPAFGLAAANGGEVAGAKILNRSGPDWTPQVYSTESFVGGAFVSWKLELNGDSAYGGVMIGLNTDPTATGWESLDYAMYLENGSSVLAYAESGSINTIASYAPTDTFAIQYDGANVRYYKNGTVIRTVAASAGIRFFLDSALSGAPGAKATITAWSAAGAVGPQGNTGPTGPTGPAGANGANGAPGAPAIGFVQDADPGAGAFVSQTWYRPTSKEWYRWTGGAWSRILGNLSAQDLIADSAFIGTGVILKANIGDLQVDTIKLAGNSVTVPSSAYTSTSTNLVSGSWVDVQSLTVSNTGAPTLLLFNAQASQIASGVYNILRFRIVRDSTVIYGPVENWSYQDENRSFSLSVTDTPAAGTYTYKVQAFLQTGSGGSGNVSHRSLVAIETKR